MAIELFNFIVQTSYEILPPDIRRQLTRAVADLIGAALAGWTTPTAQIMAGYACAIYPGREATVIGNGRCCNTVGAALANGCAANALDIDDGYRPAKGHPGAVIIPAALAQAEALGASGAEFLAAVAVGYEVALRASVAQHRSRPAYNSSGSWGSAGAAAACAHLLRLDAEQAWHALGIAEYHAPYCEVMLAVERPAMVKDGIHWGALVGTSAAQLAQRGFTGIPALLTLPAQADLTGSLGREWWIQGLYFKFYPCCRWAQPAVTGVLALRRQHGFAVGEIEAIEVECFENAAHLVTRRPRNTEEAQYSLPFPVACAAVRGQVTPEEVTGDGLHDSAILDMAERVRMRVDPALEERFPAEALECVSVLLKDGRRLSVGPLSAPGEASTPPSDVELEQKFAALTAPVIGAERARRLHEAIEQCAELENVEALAALLSGPWAGHLAR